MQGIELLQQLDEMIKNEQLREANEKIGEILQNNADKVSKMKGCTK